MPSSKDALSFLIDHNKSQHCSKYNYHHPQQQQPYCQLPPPFPSSLVCPFVAPLTSSWIYCAFAAFGIPTPKPITIPVPFSVLTQPSSTTRSKNHLLSSVSSSNRPSKSNPTNPKINDKFALESATLAAKLFALPVCQQSSTAGLTRQAPPSLFQTSPCSRQPPKAASLGSANPVDGPKSSREENASNAAAPSGQIPELYQGDDGTTISKVPKQHRQSMQMLKKMTIGSMATTAQQQGNADTERPRGFFCLFPENLNLAGWAPSLCLLISQLLDQKGNGKQIGHEGQSRVTPGGINIPLWLASIPSNPSSPGGPVKNVL